MFTRNLSMLLTKISKIDAREVNIIIAIFATCEVQTSTSFMSGIEIVWIVCT